MNDIVVGNFGGKTIYLRDVAVVHDSVEERAQETYNNGVQGAMIIVQKQSGANSVEISDAVMGSTLDYRKICRAMLNWV